MNTDIDFYKSAVIERKILLRLQAMRTRWFSQEEFDRLKFLDNFLKEYDEAKLNKEKLLKENRDASQTNK